jgi:hypothetical protein
MKEEIIKEETSILGKEKGFDIWTEFFYLKDYGFCTFGEETLHLLDPNEIVYDVNQEFEGYGVENKFPAPTQRLLQKWLKKIHDIDVIVEVYNKKYLIMLFKGLHNMNIKYYEANISILFDVYEDALEVGLVEGLKLIDEI